MFRTILSETTGKLLEKVDCDAGRDTEGLKLAEEERPEYPGLSSLVTVEKQEGRGRFAVAAKERILWGKKETDIYFMLLLKIRVGHLKFRLSIYKS